MIRQFSALVAVFALSLSAVACAAPTESQDTEVEETAQDIVSRSAYFETFEGVDGQHYFHMMAGNGEGLLRSEGYASKSSAEQGVASVLKNGWDARNFAVLEASNGTFYFTVTAANGETIATSEFYSSKTHAERGARAVRALVRISREEERARIAAAPARESFELFTGEDGDTYFRLRAANGEIILASQGYAAKDGALAGIASVKSNGVATSSFAIFQTADERWGVSLVAANGEIIATGEAYATKSSATRAVARIAEILAHNIALPE